MCVQWREGRADRQLGGKLLPQPWQRQTRSLVLHQQLCHSLGLLPCKTMWVNGNVSAVYLHRRTQTHTGTHSEGKTICGAVKLKVCCTSWSKMELVCGSVCAPSGGPSRLHTHTHVCAHTLFAVCRSVYTRRSVCVRGDSQLIRKTREGSFLLTIPTWTESQRHCDCICVCVCVCVSVHVHVCVCVSVSSIMSLCWCH